MKYKTSIKPRCKDCKQITRHGKKMIRCKNRRHNQTQG
ncbi:50S ribosomal protein L36 [Candidatus Woesebacteria bacterium]|nr:50S ribosomal protein L36 [Candidatus Woesebacteria bacterium]MCD8507623.1 50S ribosomal protein L36 [Candidatus Woesebacteria bacterium]MCD8526791.1 50S ribosomal protein L36 [Candidatus Woesebacteria bacterium]MCD8546463.1 50S ribosomal protein L36 [Candidatus Woesebacteria bacterium]